MPLPSRHQLSKSTFMMGCQCEKRLWLHKFKPDLRDALDEAQQTIFQNGTNVGKLAEQLFPGGVDARPKDPYSYPQSVADTARYICEGNTIIYEAAFQYEGLLCALDILVKKDGKWFGYEVKGSTKPKEQFIQDVAFQYYVITNAGLELEDISLTLLNTQYKRKGELDVHQLFYFFSVKQQVEAFQNTIALKAEGLKALLKQKVVPQLTIGNHCSKPYLCDFYGHCSEGIVQEEPDYGDAYINKKAIEGFLDVIEYPLYYMDFETWSSSIPEFDGHWAFRQNCFQYSVHVQRAPGSEPEHYYYLAEGVESQSLEFLEQLLSVLGDKGTVLAYNKTFEKTRLNELKREHPQYEEKVNAVLERLMDLMSQFWSHYRLPEMEGSRSIKYVLPALVPELSYDNLEIGNGGDASSAFYNLQFETDAEKKQATRSSLLEYCGLDTFAMVKIMEKLFDIINS